ncbi:MAG: hypothetical protein QOG13_1391 [Sphingomonadales bacterium]|jgi:hypothetical protein|nr:hypothetical protein [Sphingomonadales bacterium]
MPRDVADYIALALIRNDLEDGFHFGSREDFSGDLEELKSHAEQLCAFRISDSLMQRAIRTLSDCGLLRVTDDPYSGTFYKIKSSGFSEFCQSVDAELARAREENDELGLISRPSDYPSAAAVFRHELLEDYRELGSTWLSRALAGLQREVGDDGLLDAPPEAHADGTDQAPASDRVVTLTHNQQAALDEASSTLIEAVEKENAIEGDSTLRQLIVGQLRAARELIRAQTLNAYLLYSSAVAVLERLIGKYRGQAIGYAAKKLLDLLIEHVFGK